MTWAVRPYRAGDETLLTALFERAFGRPMTEAHWRWKLATQPLSVPNVFVGVSDEGSPERILHQTAGIPTRYRGPGGEVTAIVAVDGMTDPAARRRGLLTGVARHAYDRWRDAGIPFVAGLPNEQWGTRAAALGWHEVNRLVWRVRPLRPDLIIGARFGHGIGRLTRPVGEAWGRFWKQRVRRDPAIGVRRLHDATAFEAAGDQRAPRSGGYTVVRDREWIAWRYFSCPDVEYRVWATHHRGLPAGHGASRIRHARGRTFGYLAEVVAVNDEAPVYDALIGAMVQDLASSDAELVAALAVPGSALDRALRRAGFLFSWGQFSVQAVSLSGSPVVLDGLQGGDFDVV